MSLYPHATTGFEIREFIALRHAFAVRSSRARFENTNNNLIHIGVTSQARAIHCYSHLGSPRGICEGLTPRLRHGQVCLTRAKRTRACQRPRREEGEYARE